MANGFEMMLKSMIGIDPQDFKKKLEEGMNLLKNTLSHFDKRIENLEAQNSRIILQLEELTNGNKPAGKRITQRSTNGTGNDQSGRRSGDATNGPGQSESAGETAVTVNGNGGSSDS